MEYKKITENDLVGKGVVGQPDTPALSALEMQNKVEEVVRDVVIPHFNELVGALTENGKPVQSGDVMQMRIGENGDLQISADGVQWLNVADKALEGKADKDNSYTKDQLYTKEETDTKLNKKAEADKVYTKEETDKAIGDKMTEIGAGDMQKDVYDTDGDGMVDKAKTADSADKATNADNGIFTYVHTKSGTVHNLAGSGENIKFIATADWNEGDSLTINGKVTRCLNNLFERVEGEVLFKQYAYVTATMRALTDYNRCFFKQGGAGMNFKIVGGTTQPASPKENTIWVNTDVAIGEYQFSSAEPTARADGTDLQTGDVWIRIGTSSNAEFNAVKKNSIYIYPQSCLQWDGTQFVSKEMKVYKNGEWTDTLVYLLLNGVAGEDTGGFSVLTPSSTPSRGNYGFNLSSSGLKNAANGENQLNSTGTIEKFNATGMSTLYVEYTVSGVSKEYWFAFGLSANRNVYWSNYNSFSSQPWAAYNSYHKKAAGTYVDAIDISNLNGKHYFNACLLISGDYATCTLNITKIWMV